MLGKLELQSSQFLKYEVPENMPDHMVPKTHDKVRSDLFYPAADHLNDVPKVSA